MEMRCVQHWSVWLIDAVKDAEWKRRTQNSTQWWCWFWSRCACYACYTLLCWPYVMRIGEGMRATERVWQATAVMCWNERKNVPCIGWNRCIRECSLLPESVDIAYVMYMWWVCMCWCACIYMCTLCFVTIGVCLFEFLFVHMYLYVQVNFILYFSYTCPLKPLFHRVFFTSFKYTFYMHAFSHISEP